MDDEAYADILRRDAHLDRLEDQQLQELVDRCTHRRMVTGEALWANGDAGESAYVLLSGRVELSWRVHPDGKQKKQITQPATLLGLPHLIHAWEHESAAYPLERTEVLQLERSDFDQLFGAQHPAAYRLVDAVAEELVEEVRDANRRLHEVFGHPAETLRMLRRRGRGSERRGGVPGGADEIDR